MFSQAIDYMSVPYTRTFGLSINPVSYTHLDEQRIAHAEKLLYKKLDEAKGKQAKLLRLSLIHICEPKIKSNTMKQPAPSPIP